MTHELAEPQPWRRGRWAAFIALVFGTQLGLILWLGRPEPVVPRLADLAPSLQLVGPGAAQMLALTDPTLFALPHREGFSGAAWLTIPIQEYQPFVWSEPPRWLTLAQDRLGADFEEFMLTNQPSSLPVFAQPELELMRPTVAESDPFPTQSTLRFLGELAGRRLLVPLALPSWTNADILTNSVVQVLVAADGKPVSGSLLKKSGATEADQHALREARTARFEPVNVSDPTNPLAGLTWGQLVFEWHTLPMPATNNAISPGSAK